MTKIQYGDASLLTGELLKEFETVAAMVWIYCRKHHQSEGLCSECADLISYAETKLDRCPFGQNKPTCNRCPVHCYKPQQKLQMKSVMRFSGPRMLLWHPKLALRHLLHEKKTVPNLPLNPESNRHLRLQKAKNSK
ncbi:nitrous oxide-stimulated promoter family protein [Vibrio sp. SM6]|uniref:Nitrous oxide-stimulated promoter family protein n=1 Tax=Vibrio agarilyticus TaxID=2726741 RepID=A0A7X8TNQ3_9VIBR|nr:nitrous oxide-stimulated promoter family protein [Vibrio agarilyticus]NLS11368.1 nitrous oxide-stimulated promoter family protein [Vibrio agarilyticus]